MKLSIQLHLVIYRFQILFEFSRYWVLNGPDRLFITRFKMQIYIPIPVEIRLGDEQYWLYTAIGPEPHEPLHKTFSRLETEL